MLILSIHFYILFSKLIFMSEISNRSNRRNRVNIEEINDEADEEIS